MANTAETQNKIDSLKSLLARDLEACDLKWTLFVAAAHSYRYDSRLTPYPQTNPVTGASDASPDAERFDIVAIRRSIETVPELRSIRWQDLTVAVVDLMHWLLCEQSESSTMRTVPKEKFSEVMAKVVSDYPADKPTQIIELVPAADSMAEHKFRAHLELGHQSLFAFHGSKIDSFHSITSHGLQQHLCKTAMFGDGIYLSSEMHVSQMFSPVNVGWRQSQLGAEMSCVALCEFIDHPVHLKRHAKENNRADSGVPEKYFVITNNDTVRVRYLIIYGASPAGQLAHRFPGLQQHTVLPSTFQPPSRLWLWVAENKAAIVVAAYVVLLLLIGLASSRTGLYWRHVFWSKVETLVESWTWTSAEADLPNGVQWPTIRTPSTAEL